MFEKIWSFIAGQLARPAVVDWLIRRAQRTPYVHITGPDGSVYMERYWLFNPYPAESSGQRAWWKFPISVRLHHIRREDDDRGAMHDHPWNARTIILRGGYTEVRPLDLEYASPRISEYPITRRVGETAKLRFNEYHRIVAVADGGAWTLFITGRYRGTWGFKVDGAKVPWREFLGMPAKGDGL